jgi:hypothetical protein
MKLISTYTIEEALIPVYGRELIPPASAKDPVRSGESKATVSRERTVYQTRAINFEYGTDTNPWEKYSDIRRKLEGR